MAQSFVIRMEEESRRLVLSTLAVSCLILLSWWAFHVRISWAACLEVYCKSTSSSSSSTASSTDMGFL